jgi:hypothetical protein
MQIELSCPSCPCRFVAASEAKLEQIVERMIEDGTWYALAEGNSFEHMIRVALEKRGAIHCPECGAVVEVRESDVQDLLPIEAALV